MSEAKHRMTLEFKDVTHKRLLDVVKISGAASKAEAILRSVHTYATIAEGLQAGDTLIIKRADGTEVELIIPELIKREPYP